MGTEKKIILIMLIITGFVLLVSLSSLYVQIQIESGYVCGCAIPLYLFIPFLSSLGLFIGALIYYFLRPAGRSDIKKISGIIIKFLDKDEADVVRVIFENENVTQARIVKTTGMPKVKVFRILEKLRQKGIIEKEDYGKTNLIRLSKPLMDYLKEK